VDVSTIHRAIRSGELGAYRVGRGALRIPGDVLSAYLDRCAQAATRTESPADDEDGLTPTQADGLACVVCAVDYLERNTLRRPVGRSRSGSQVFACCAHRAVRHAVSSTMVSQRSSLLRSMVGVQPHRYHRGRPLPPATRRAVLTLSGKSPPRHRSYCAYRDTCEAAYGLLPSQLK